VTKKTEPTCDDCYFRREGLCALALERPCPTFRAVKGGEIVPPRQPRLVARTATTFVPTTA
jgi:hypothetical protein